MITFVKGDLLELAEEGSFDVILHGCNCFHAMGGGIARQIAKQYPGALEADKRTVKGDKLGTFSSHVTDKFVILNCYTQLEISSGEDVFDYDSFEKCLWSARELYHGKRFGMPKIGAGLAHGDWRRILKIIESVMWYENVTIVELAR